MTRRILAAIEAAHDAEGWDAVARWAAVAEDRRELGRRRPAWKQPRPTTTTTNQGHR